MATDLAEHQENIPKKSSQPAAEHASPCGKRQKRKSPTPIADAESTRRDLPGRIGRSGEITTAVEGKSSLRFWVGGTALATMFVAIAATLGGYWLVKTYQGARLVRGRPPGPDARCERKSCDHSEQRSRKAPSKAAKSQRLPLARRCEKSPGNFDQAVTDLTAALQTNPRLVEARAERAFAYQQKGNQERALEDYTEAMRSGLRSWKAFTERGLILLQRREPARAVAAYLRKPSIWNPLIQLILSSRALAPMRRWNNLNRPWQVSTARCDSTRTIRRQELPAATFTIRREKSRRHWRTTQNFARRRVRNPARNHPIRHSLH